MTTIFALIGVLTAARWAILGAKAAWTLRVRGWLLALRSAAVKTALVAGTMTAVVTGLWIVAGVATIVNG